MRTLTLVSSTIFVSMSCALAKETLVQLEYELFDHPHFQRHAPKIDVKQPDPQRASLRNIKKGRVLEDRTVHELYAVASQQTDNSDMRTSVKGLPRGKVEEARAKFEPTDAQKATPVPVRSVTKPKPEEGTREKSSWASVFGFGSLSNISVSGFFGTVDATEDPEVQSVPISAAPQPTVEESTTSSTGWFGWASQTITTTVSSLFAEEKPVQTVAPSKKPEKVNVQETEDNGSFLQRSFKMVNDTTNWLADMFWGTPKQPEEELPLSLEDVEDLETIHLPAAKAVVFRTGFENQEAGVLEVLAKKDKEVGEKYYGERKLSLDEALRKAEYVQEEISAWIEVQELPRLTRQRRRTI